MTIKVQKPITFKNNCDCIVDYDELEKAILWFSPRPVLSLKAIYIVAKYPAVSICSKKIHVHRLIMMYWEGRKLSTKEYVHHKDHNKLNATRGNLEVVDQSEHQSMHNKGRVFTEEHRRKIGESNRRRKGIKLKTWRGRAIL